VQFAQVIVSLAGGLVGGLVAVSLSARKERSAVRAASRLLLADLANVRGELAYAVDHNRWGDLCEISLPSWSAARETLAGGLSETRWEAVFRATQDVRSIAVTASDYDRRARIDTSTSDGSPKVDLSPAFETLEKAIEALAPRARWERFTHPS
jgi:hypothetical protein